ncbi:Ribose 1,5-bisphosphate phosphokinase PhnN [Pseudoruegeria aquimaris]|uniref:Ribose 1,5-bisphosphate phosphokinase PhnN n=1 Tax=Pseudoruegeria aquimaris TaxID=393663 RepID=A0A1Y5RNM1_9RHOB|nr:phosphonate metabolism protein/1,5-bisphosphokinase (PRPP-forming) PhnN [Pseudoruegeria aquimaris]MBC7133942.1 phosphonate metabolism protein/1,5-bisphosphokinase (PRPP-forming) PhnN [Roseovarius sp.]SLN20566.1 Ribose 1,5-bisphosphate phosphokinase PhnN [Pseudoruegeria aquimaris]
MPGALFAIVGPSGAGKDTLMRAAAQRLPALHLVRRVITRPSAAGGEDFEGVSEAEFARRLAAGEFVLHWQAHGLRYGIPAQVREVLGEGRQAIFNGSRAMLAEARAQFPALRVIHVTARPEVLAARLAARGRESTEDIAARLARAEIGLPAGIEAIEIDNSGALEAAVEALVAALQPESEKRSS